MTTLPTYDEAAQSEVDAFPQLDTLPPPRQLLTRGPPLLIIVQAELGKDLKIHSNHSQSLELIKAYFEKHAQKDNRTPQLPSLLKFEFATNFFSRPETRDGLVVSIAYRRDDGKKLALSPVPIMTFIEVVLGYRQVAATIDCLHYRRDRGFSYPPLT